MDKYDALLDAVDELLTAWQFWPPEEYGSTEAMVPTDIIINLQNAYDGIDNDIT